ncbi:SDR family NAD(P)-dependent oxidoreductase [bacterium]|nr:SDR family NAD(P)-dependent oxidoreductase [bacterium]
MPGPDLLRRYGPMALVTGASDGIGRAFAQSLAARGFDLVLVARRGEVLQALGKALTAQHGVKVIALPVDLAEADAVPQILRETEGLPIGLLVAAAGYGSAGPFLTQDAGTEAGMVDVNCRSVLELTHGIGRRLAVQRRGGVVLFGSLVGFQGAPMSATYAATKNFIQAFAEGFAAEVKGQGIDVLSVAPGPVGSGFGARAGMSMARAATPQSVAEGALAVLGRRITTRPGPLSKLLGWSLAILPRPARVRLMGRIMGAMAGRG